MQNVKNTKSVTLRQKRLWLYPPSEYPCFLLSRMRREIVTLKLKVGYPGCFHEPAPASFFRRRVEQGRHHFEAVGTVKATLDGTPVEVERDGLSASLTVPRDGILLLEVSVPDTHEAIPSIRFEPAEGWEASTDGSEFAAADQDEFQHEPEQTEPRDLVEFAPGRYDASIEVFAHIEIESTSEPSLHVGESVPEMENRDPAHFEQSTALSQTSPGRWRTPLPLAFRYARVESDTPVVVHCQSITNGATLRGMFNSDEELDYIWNQSAYTLHLCNRKFLLDGIKRDRLPWLGDLAISLMADAYTFADPLPVRRTLAAIGRAGIKEKHLNGIIDYTLWFFICHDKYQLYFGDRDFLVQQYPLIREILRDIFAIAERNGGLLPTGGGWCFIDWLKMEKSTALQMLYHWALLSTAELGRRMDDVEVSRLCHEKAAALKARLMDSAYDGGAGLFRAKPCDADSPFLRHPNFLAVLSGVASEDVSARIADALCTDEMPAVGTPYMASLEILALHRAGEDLAAISRIRRIWGGMAEMGATTFYEAFDEKATADESLVFYGRPYGRSLCHAWSSGPAALLPIIAFGCEPTDDGWSDFCVAKSSPLHEATATVPIGGDATLQLRTEHGAIKLDRHPDNAR